MNEKIREFTELKPSAIASRRPSEGWLYLESMTDPVRVLSVDGEVLYENQSMLHFCQRDDMHYDSFAISPLLSAETLRTQSPNVTEICAKGHVFSVKSSPLFEQGQLIGVIEVFHDTTIQNNLTVELFNANQRLRKDMSLARSIQASMLPRLTRFGNLRFDSRYIPSDQLSGDFFDLIPISDHQLGVYIADVVGHGISASILTMFIRQSMRNILQEEHIYEPQEVFAKLREHFCAISIEDSQYFTAFYGVLDIAEHRFSYANAGHNGMPIWCHQEECIRLEAKGLPISNVFCDANAETRHIQMQAGDRLLLYTDGVTETCNAQGTRYDQENLETILKCATKDTLTHVLEDLRHFRADRQRDDMALLLIQVEDSVEMLGKDLVEAASTNDQGK